MYLCIQYVLHIKYYIYIFYFQIRACVLFPLLQCLPFPSLGWLSSQLLCLPSGGCPLLAAPLWPGGSFKALGLSLGLAASAWLQRQGDESAVLRAWLAPTAMGRHWPSSPLAAGLLTPQRSHPAFPFTLVSKKEVLWPARASATALHIPESFTYYSNSLSFGQTVLA